MSKYSVLEMLGVDPDNMVWSDLATCRGIAVPDLFFDIYEQDVESAKATDQMCLHCPIIAKCFIEGVAEQSTGCWGGVYLAAGEVDMQRNAHKTPDTWHRLEEIHGPLLGPDQA